MQTLTEGAVIVRRRPCPFATPAFRQPLSRGTVALLQAAHEEGGGERTYEGIVSALTVPAKQVCQLLTVHILQAGTRCTEAKRACHHNRPGQS